YRWSVPPSGGYKGAFADSGKLFCAVPFVDVHTSRQVTCRTVATGEEVARVPVHWGGGGLAVETGGTRMTFEERDIHFVPKLLVRPLDTEYIIGGRSQVVWDFIGGQLLTAWKTESQKVLPHKESDHTYALSPDGKLVARGGAGEIALYGI